MIAIAFILIIMAASTVSYIIFGDASLFFIICSGILCIYTILKMNLSKSVKFMIIFAFLIRVVFVFIDLYCFRLPDAGFDDDGFYRLAMAMRDGYSALSINSHGGLYSVFICLLSYLIGTVRVGLQFTNVIFYTVSIVFLNKSLDEIGCRKKTKNKLLLFISFMPYIMISNSILRRDTLITCLLVVSIYYIIKWCKKRSAVNMFISMGCVGIASLLHAASLFAIPVYLCTFMFYSHKNKKHIFTGASSFKIVLLFLVLFIFGGYFLTNFSSKLSKFDSIDSVYSTINVSRGGSAYLTNMQVDSIPKLIFYTPIKTIYFLLSPMPWNFRGIIDILAFCTDSFAYLFLVFNIIKNKKNHNSMSKMFMFVAIIISIIYALGTFTSGTAIRHRYNVLPYLFIVYAILDIKNIRNGVEDDEY